MNDIKKEAQFRDRLELLIQERGLKQIDISEGTGITQASISRYRSGDFLPKDAQLQRLAAYFNVSQQWLNGYNVPRERKIVPPGEMTNKEIAYMWLNTEATTIEIVQLITAAAEKLNEK